LIVGPLRHRKLQSNKAMDADAGGLLAHPARRGSSPGVIRPKGRRTPTIDPIRRKILKTGGDGDGRSATRVA
jgi:hypothetical protein